MQAIFLQKLFVSAALRDEWSQVPYEPSLARQHHEWHGGTGRRDHQNLFSASLNS
jgi:hypothetical protein